MTDTIKPNSRNYWGIIAHQELYFNGTFAECWDKLVADFGTKTLNELVESGVVLCRVK